MAAAHILDDPARAALWGEQSGHAVIEGHARRFDPGIGPIAALRDDGDTALRDAARLIALHGTIASVGRPLPPIAGTRVVKQTPIAQMVFDGTQDRVEDEAITVLGPDNAEEMMALAQLTEPGPFGPRTGALGPFLGIFDEGRLVAMAGQRMRPAGYVEISGVCTHPDARGRGFARLLSRAQIEVICKAGRTPFLHAYIDRPGPIRLYEGLGFVKRAEPMHMLVAPEE